MIPSQQTVSPEPNWRPEARYTNAILPPRQRRWLLDDGSLTARLISTGAGIFTVTRLFQGWRPPMPSEQRRLRLASRQLALVREVVLSLDSNPVVFARSVFPVASLEGELRHLRKLQNRSLGAILFSHPAMHRTPFELARLPGDSRYIPSALHQSEPAWGRRSCFELGGKSLMVSEVFLEGFKPWADILPVHRSQRGRVVTAINRQAE
ncbi:chorismate--pyruvate lyase family protein [Halioglobus pacificus]|uniref:Probable chorismate pyruvate-lyase n=1 Tax=Parahalioglobus pacificus TaxID=930806 RepID=A0A919CKY7_9GAMM|nr:chorismate lyase [Halioglobus pacificus]GHD34976.1 hypothetical protein GCM10007053_21330 [Halioglobus pacificus]